MFRSGVLVLDFIAFLRRLGVYYGFVDLYCLCFVFIVGYLVRFGVGE